MIHTNGWRYDLEDKAFLAQATAEPIPRSFSAAALPDEVRPDIGPDPHRLENQSSMGSCQGHDIASCIEDLMWVAGGGNRIQLSNIFAYLATQKIDGLLGSDRGSTISGGVKLAQNHGVCSLEYAPYPNPVRYPDDREIARILSPENYEAAKPYRIKKTYGIRSYDDAVKWIGGGGAISLGISWPPIFAVNPEGRKVARRAAGSGGGHAIAVIGYRKTGNLIVANSHNYWFEIPADVFNSMLRQRYTVAIGVSDMAEPAPRKVSQVKESLDQWADDAVDGWESES
ncbi:hypothetical protein KOR42_05920 [Thalassoglobus neptunius]|uniref:Peptidase C39-like domain-containing protein n=1 Tax=Thalassoglobus neptunius TaxID=1938619 RepID=A0A5C5X278_9PLAN|nr:hypothetical protein [Thalassoglobus neptunius]TWT57234.1 hypothetical protein KOR42_05920 [Thalassoglobus neptunius]